MAYPKEKEHLDYLAYVERHGNGEEAGPLLSKEDWRKKQSGEKSVADVLYPKATKEKEEDSK